MRCLRCFFIGFDSFLISTAGVAVDGSEVGTFDADTMAAKETATSAATIVDRIFFMIGLLLVGLDMYCGRITSS